MINKKIHTFGLLFVTGAICFGGDMMPTGGPYKVDSKVGLTFTYIPAPEPDEKGVWRNEPDAQANDWKTTGRVFSFTKRINSCHAVTNAAMLDKFSIDANSGSVSCKGKSASIQGSI